MTQQVRLKIQPDQTVRFPNICVNCTRVATERTTLRKREGHRTRQIDVPLCETCAAELTRLSGDEERLQKIVRLLTGVAFMSLVLIVLLITPGSMLIWFRLLAAAVLGAVAAFVVYRLFRPLVSRAARPQKQTILAAACLDGFSWRSTTFSFANDTFAQRFRALNEELILES